MTVDQLYDYIVKQITPEQALKKLLEGSLITYEKLKFPEGSEPVHPLILIANAAMDMGWDICIEKDTKEVDGISVGTEDYLNRTFPKNEK